MRESRTAMEKHRSSMNQGEIYRVLTENPPLQNAA